MKHANLKNLRLPAAVLTFATIALTSATAQTAKPKMATDIPPEITTPDTVETRIGTLKFFDGLPDKDTVLRQPRLSARRRSFPKHNARGVALRDARRVAQRRRGQPDGYAV